MCERNSVLIVFLVIKIIIMLLLPIMLYVLYKKKNKYFDIVSIINIVVIILFIILRLFNNECIKNSTITYLRNLSKKENVVTEKDENISSVYSNKTYMNNRSKEVYYYNNNTYPLSNVALKCDKKSYLKHYGNSISALTMLMSNEFESEFDEIDIKNYAENNKLVDCNNGINFENLFVGLASKYSFKIYQINSNQIDSYLLNGTSILVETINKPDEDNNFGCEKDYIVIYNKNNNGYYNIMNPNDKDHSYFCPSNSIGYGSIINENQNDNNYSFDDINNKALRYFVIGVE